MTEPVCPHCGNAKVEYSGSTVLQNGPPLRRFKCLNCGEFFRFDGQLVIPAKRGEGVYLPSHEDIKAACEAERAKWPQYRLDRMGDSGHDD